MMDFIQQKLGLIMMVIGGLIFATFATLIFVPVVFSMVHKRQPAAAARTSEMAYAH